MHVKGKENVLADGLSRLPTNSIPYRQPDKEDSWSEAVGGLEANNLLETDNRSETEGRPQANWSETDNWPEAYNRLETYNRLKTDDRPQANWSGTENWSGTDNQSERWKTWLEGDWYGDVAHFLVYGKLRTKDAGDGSLPVWRWSMRKIANFRLMDDNQDYPLLAYVERSGDQAWCVWECEANRDLQWAHDCHGHYSADLTIKTLMGHYFWPTRHRDAVRYCRSCPSCQLTVRPTPSQVPTSIIQVRPMASAKK